ncbi:hypothetical protein C446_01803 [Halobiforma nitratireducens JCM 10879]|uniref:Uncharacterized protein n=2 Tax=Halobiforma nitratireducens TaxID=130048 RepID=M0MKS3_9EURY|nr:hypothetical protein C446_01803 [Halobiforma nitratireducens JCM 10879]
MNEEGVEEVADTEIDAFFELGEDDLDDIWIGQTIAIEISDELSEDDPAGAELRDGFAGDDGDSVDNSRIYSVEDHDTGETGLYAVFDETDGLEDDSPHHLHVVLDDGGEDDYYQTTFWPNVMDFEAAFDSSTVREDGEDEIEFSSDREERYDLNVTSDDLDAEDLGDIFEDIGADESDDDDTLSLEGVENTEYEADFDGIDVGEYDIDFDVTDTVDEDNASIEVSDEETDFAFTDIENPEQGDYGNVTIDVAQADDLAVMLGSYDDGYVSWAEFDDVEHGEVVLEFNTHSAEDDPWSVHDDYDDNASLDAQDVDAPDFDADDPFPAHNWDIKVGESLENTESGDDVEFEDREHDRDRLDVDDRLPVGDVTAETAPEADSVVDFSSYEDATITETDTIAEEDAAILTVNDFNAEGLAIDLDDDDLYADGLIINVTEQDTGPIGEPDVWSTAYEEEDIDADDELEVSLINSDRDDYEGDLIFVIDNADDLGVDEDYDVTVSITEDNRYVVDEDEEIEQEFELSVEEREVDWDAISSLPAADDATATGTTNIAPGTELDAEANSDDDDGSFVEFTDAEVTEGDNGEHEFAAEFELGDEEVGVLFDLIVDDPLPGSDVSDDVEDVELIDADADEPATFDVDATAPAEVEVGEDATLEVTVTNTGDVEGVSNYSVVVDGDQLSDEEIELESGDSAENTYDLPTDAEATVEWEAATDHDSESGTLEVTEEDAAPGDDDDDDDDTGVDDDDDDDDDDEDETPGFGVAVAVVALLAAAMLALRRQD